MNGPPGKLADLSDLCVLLTELYPTIGEAREIARRATLNVRRIDFAAAPGTTWHNVLEEARKSRLVSQVIEVAADAYEPPRGDLAAARVAPPLAVGRERADVARDPAAAPSINPSPPPPLFRPR